MGANEPSRYEKFVVPDGVLKIEHVKDTKVEHAATFIIQREDHTVGNAVRMQLHRDPHVTFAGYKIPHPLEYRMLIKVQTDGADVEVPDKGLQTYEPEDALNAALDALQNEMQEMESSFATSLQRYKEHARNTGIQERDGYLAYGNEIPRTDAEFLGTGAHLPAYQ
eukprot:jgi/Astpho2/2196/Aster-03186